MSRKFGFSFSLKRASGLSGAKSRISRKTGIPLTRSGRQRKAARAAGCCVPIVFGIGFFAFAIYSVAGDFTNRYPTLTDLDGKTYSNASPLRVSGGSLMVSHSKGIVSIPLASLPLNLIAELKISQNPVKNASVENGEQEEASKFLLVNTVINRTKGRELKGDFDYWFDVHNLSDKPFSGVMQLRAINEEKGGLGVVEYDLFLGKYDKTTLKLNAPFRPHNDGIDSFSATFIDESGKAIFKTSAFAKLSFQETD